MKAALMILVIGRKAFQISTRHNQSNDGIDWPANQNIIIKTKRVDSFIVLQKFTWQEIPL